jgi:hypothetical protein
MTERPTSRPGLPWISRLGRAEFVRPLLLLACLSLLSGGAACRKGQAGVPEIDGVEDSLNAILKQTIPALQTEDAAALRLSRDELIRLRLRAGKLVPSPSARIMYEQFTVALDAVIDAVDAAIKGAEKGGATLGGQDPNDQVSRLSGSAGHMERCEECLRKAAQALNVVHEERARLTAGQ